MYATTGPTSFCPGRDRTSAKSGSIPISRLSWRATGKSKQSAVFRYMFQHSVPLHWVGSKSRGLATSDLYCLKIAEEEKPVTVIEL
jgi:hypothetical protein